MMEALHDVFRWVLDGLNGFFSGMIGAALMGRLAWHTRLAQAGKRALFGPELLYEAPIVGLAGYVGAGIAAYFDLNSSAAGGLCAVLGYFGPVGIQALISSIAKMKGADINLDGGDK